MPWGGWHGKAGWGSDAGHAGRSQGREERPRPWALEGRKVTYETTRSALGVDGGDGGEPRAGLADTELDTQKLLKWQMLCTLHHMFYKRAEVTDSGRGPASTDHRPGTLPTTPHVRICAVVKSEYSSAGLSCPEFFNSKINPAQLMSSPVIGFWRI